MGKRKGMTTVLAMVTALSIIIGCIPYKPAVAAKDTVYKENELLYWRIDDGNTAPTIKIKTANVPVSCTYTKPLVDEVPYNGTAADYFVDENPGSTKSYGDTLKNAGVLESLGTGIDEKLFHRNPIEPENMSLFSYWGKRVVHTYDTDKKVAEVDKDGLPVYNYNKDNANGIEGLPSVLTDTGMLTYKINYKGNAILVPKYALTYYTDVQGEFVEVTSDDDVKLQYAVEKSNVKSSDINWILGLNTTTVRLEADYTYTRLVPMEEGKFVHRLFDGTGYQVNGNITYTYKDPLIKKLTSPGEYSSSDIGTKTDTSIPQYNNGVVDSYYNYGSFYTKVTDDITGYEFEVISNCPVQAVKETIHYYMDVECYIIDTDMVKNSGQDKNVYLKDFLRNNEVREDYRFAKNKASFSVKYKYGEGFSVSGISRNANLEWINGTHVTDTVAGFDGELIEWWAGQSAVHHYSTPDSLNKDVDVDRYMDYGVTLHFMDANNPVKVINLKIPARAKAPKITTSVKNGKISLIGLKAKKVGIRLSDNDGNFINLKTLLPTTWKKFFEETTYLMKGDSATSPHGDQSFYVFSGGESGRDKDINILELFNLNENNNFNVFGGAFVECQTVASKKKAPSRISAIYINPQDVFNTGKSDKQSSIILEEGYITISDADRNNIYEYCIPGSYGVVDKWTKISNSKRTKVKDLYDKSIVYIRKVSKETNDKSLFIPSSYISLKYNGQGAGVPDAYYMDDYYRKGDVVVNLINDTNYPVMIGGTEVAPKATKLLATASNTVFRNYISKTRLVTGLNDSSSISVTAGSKTITITGITDTEIRLSDLLGRLKEEYGNEWTTVYNSAGIKNITANIVSYDDSKITKSDEEAYSVIYNDGEKDYTYHPVHLLRYMLGA
jgi:hypothetical protein